MNGPDARTGPDTRTGSDARTHSDARTGSDARTHSDDGANQVWGLICTLVAGPAVWGAVGYGIDAAAGTGFWTPFGVVVGFLTSFYIVYATSTHQSTRQALSTTPATTQHGRSEVPRRDAARPDPGDVR